MCITLTLIIIYVLILIMPFISAVNLGISGIYFLYYWAGIIVVCINNSRLGAHQFTERMVPQNKAPPFEGQLN